MTIREEVTQAVYRNVSKCFDRDMGALSAETRLSEDLGAKSVNFVQVIGFLEEELSLEISFMAFRRRNSIGNIIDFLVEEIN